MTKTPDDGIDALADTLWQLWRLWSERSTTPKKFSAEQFWVLRPLERESALTVSALAERRGVTRPAMTIATQRMETAGWVARVRAPENHRHVVVTLTDSGRELWLRVSRERRRVLRELIRRITPEEQTILFRIAMKMRGLLDSELDSPPKEEMP